jgi:adenosine deaminase
VPTTPDVTISEAVARAPKVLLHDHLDGGLRPQTIIDIARETGYDALPETDAAALGTWFRESADSGSLERYLETFAHTVGVMQTRESLVRVASECAQDLAADGVVYAEVRFAPEQHLQAGLSLAEVVEAVLEGFREGEATAAAAGHRIRVGTLVTAMRQAANHMEIARLAVRYRDLGVVGFDIAGPEAGFPPTRSLDAFEYLRRENAHFTIHAGEAFGLPSIWEAIQWCGADRLGHGVRIVDDLRIGSRPYGADPEADAAARAEDVGLGRLAAYVRDMRIPLEMCPSSNVQTGAAPSIAAHPIWAAGSAAVPRHGQHRQPADERHVDVARDAAARRRPRLGPRRPAVGDGERDEERVHPVRRAARPHRRRHQARLRHAARPGVSHRP